MAQTKAAKRPLLRQLIWLCIAIGAMLAIHLLPLPAANGAEASLSPAGKSTIAVLAFSLILWITEVIPFHITGLTACVLLTLFRADTFVSVIKAGFGSDSVVFFMGVLIISAVISTSGLDRRFSVFVLSKTGNRTGAVLLGFLVAGVVISMWITAMAGAAILLPLAKSVLQEERVKPRHSNFGKALMIACAWGPLIGGIATPAGSSPNPIAIAFVRDMLGVNIGFFDWMLYGIPCAALLVLPAWFILMKMYPPEIQRLSKTREQLKRDFATLPAMNRNERAAVAVFGLTIALWLFTPLLETWLRIGIPTSMPAVLGGCLCFFPGFTTFRWKGISTKISWDGIILVATGMSLGLTLNSTGAAAWLATILLGNVLKLPALLLIFMIIMIIMFIKIGLSSNGVTATVVTPMIIALAASAGLTSEAAMALIIPSNLTLSLAFVLVTSSPTSVIPYSAGYFSISDFAKSGAVMTVVAAVIMTFAIYGIGSLSGVY
ncbi:MAG: DASS family sodium-coupled anion symporter [Candidatus Limiplasma sp.]|nr:DASS family sodium-coupled anion symporter [Candidatus Limiplasma sp.]